MFLRARVILTHVRSMAAKVGDKLPTVTLTEGNPGGKVVLTELFAGKKGILFGVPGAFTPGCSKTHLPGYIQDFDKITAKGVSVIACVSVNDPFVMAAWGEQQGAEGKVRMLADAKGELAGALGLLFDASANLGNHRCRRFAMVVEDNTIKALNIEENPGGLTCSLSNEILKHI